MGNPQIPPFPAFFQPGELRPHLAELRSHLSLPRRQSPSEERSPETPRFGAFRGFFSFLFFFWGRFSSLAKEFFRPQVRGGNEKLLPVPSRSSRAEERNNLYKFRARDAPRLALFAPISAFFWGRKKKIPSSSLRPKIPVPAAPGLCSLLEKGNFCSKILRFEGFSSRLFTFFSGASPKIHSKVTFLGRG